MYLFEIHSEQLWIRWVDSFTWITLPTKNKHSKYPPIPVQVNQICSVLITISALQTMAVPFFIQNSYIRSNVGGKVLIRM